MKLPKVKRKPFDKEKFMRRAEAITEPFFEETNPAPKIKRSPKLIAQVAEYIDKYKETTVKPIEKIDTNKLTTYNIYEEDARPVLLVSYYDILELMDRVNEVIDRLNDPERCPCYKCTDR